MTLVLPVLLLAACNPPLPDDSKPPRDDSGTPTDTQTTPPVTTYNWVVAEMTVASGLDGFDLDGDGDKDNALAPLDAVIDPVLEATLRGAERVMVLQLAGLDDFADDTAIRAAVVGADDLDTDHDPSDNFSGDEAYDAGTSVDADGNAKTFNEVPLSAGTYTAVFPARDVQVGANELTATTELHLGGRSVSERDQAGLYGFAVSVQSFLDFAEAQGMDGTDLDRLSALADIDTDQDGDADSISTAFEFQAVSCTLN